MWEIGGGFYGCCAALCVFVCERGESVGGMWNDVCGCYGRVRIGRGNSW